MIKKIYNKIKSKIQFNKLFYIIIFLIPFIILLFHGWHLDNDAWFLFNHGKYVLNNGIPYIEPFTIHGCLKFIMQQWLTSCIFWLIYSCFNQLGMFILTIIINVAIILALYKLCMLISNKNKFISSVITITIDSLMVYFGYIVTRPQIITYLIIILLLIIIEYYIKFGKTKILFLIPIISILEMNLHMAMFWMIYIFF